MRGMPHPIPKGVYPDIAWTSVSSRPELAVKIASIMATWTHVEVEMGDLLTRILGAHAAAAIPMYLALVGSSAQRGALTKMVHEVLDQDLAKRFDNILIQMRKRANERNALVHGIWAVHPSYPDDLILVEIEDLMRMKAMVQAWRFDRSNPQPAPLSTGSIYKAADFESIAQRIAEYHLLLRSFVSEVSLAVSMHRRIR